MGYDATAILFYGVLADEEEFYEMQAVPGCNHSHNHKFCPECGAKASSMERTPIDGFDDEDGIKFKGLDFEPQSCEGGKGVLGFCLGSTNLDEKIVVAMGVERTRSEATILMTIVGSKFEGRRIERYIILGESY